MIGARIRVFCTNDCRCALALGCPADGDPHAPKSSSMPLEVIALLSPAEIGFNTVNSGHHAQVESILSLWFEDRLKSF